MNITITINNPNAAVLKALGDALPDHQADVAHLIGSMFGKQVSAPADAPLVTPGAATNRITADDLDDLDVDDRVHWHGAKFEFNGTVLSVNYEATGGDKAVYVRRDDNGKKVSLTADDLDNHSLTIID